MPILHGQDPQSLGPARFLSFETEMKSVTWPWVSGRPGVCKVSKLAFFGILAGGTWGD